MNSLQSDIFTNKITPRLVNVYKKSIGYGPFWVIHSAATN